MIQYIIDILFIACFIDLNHFMWVTDSSYCICAYFVVLKILLLNVLCNTKTQGSQPTVVLEPI